MAADQTLTLSSGASDYVFGSTEVWSAIRGVSSGTRGVVLNTRGHTLAVSSIDHLHGAAGFSREVVTLAGAGNTLGVARLETLIGSAGQDVVLMATTGSSMAVESVESIIGNAVGTNLIMLSSDAGNTMSVSSIRSLVGSAGKDVITIGSEVSGSTMVVRNLETLIGSAGLDLTATISGGSNTIYLENTEIFLGNGSLPNDTVHLSSGGATIGVSFLETLIGSGAVDVATMAYKSGSVDLRTGGGTLSVSAIETIVGGTGSRDAVILLDAGSTITVAHLETMIGSNGNDVVTMTIRDGTPIVGTDTVLWNTSGTTMQVSGIETITGTSASDVLIAFYTSGSTVQVSQIETLIGKTGGGIDAAVLANGGNTVSIDLMDTVIGGTGNDVVNLTSSLATRGHTIAVDLVEALVGGSGNDAVSVAASGLTRGSTLSLTSFETMIGGSGNDVLTLAESTGTIFVSAIETIYTPSQTLALTGADQTIVLGALPPSDILYLQASGTTAVNSYLTIIGSAGYDVVSFTRTEGTTMAVEGLEEVHGSGQQDVVSINSTAGTTMLVSNIEQLVGNTGHDAIALDNAGATLAVIDVEEVAGGSGTDVITWAGTGGFTLSVSLLETLVGGTGVDVALLGDGGSTIVTSQIDQVLGGSGVDVISVSGTEGAVLDGGGGADSLTGGAGSDSLIGGDGQDTMTGGGGADQFDVTNDDTITDFTFDTDTIRLSGVVVPGSAISVADSGADTIITIGTVSVTLIGQAGLKSEELNVTSNGGSTHITATPAPPTVIGIAVDGSPAVNATSVSYTVTFNRAVTGVDANDFSVINTRSSETTLTGSITSVTGSGDTYTIVVGSLTGEGTLRLDFNGSGSGVTDGRLSAIAAVVIEGGTTPIDTIAPTDPSGSLYVSDGAPIGTIVGTIAAQDGNPLTYSLVDDAAGTYQIDATTGVITVLDPSGIAFSNGVQTIRVRASDGTNETLVDLDVANGDPSAPADTDATTDAVAENVATGTLVGVTAQAVDPHGGGLTYSLLDDAGGRFQIDGATGVVSVLDGSLLDFETTASHTITVQADNGIHGRSTQNIVIAITDVDEPAVAQDDAFSVAENGTLSGSLFTANPTTPDIDVDSALAITAVSGGGTIGTAFALASGAILTVHADGTFDYDPNGVFDALPGSASGASNTQAIDSFTYTLAGGSTATVTITIDGVASGADLLLGTTGNDTLTGSFGNDTIVGGLGADDSAGHGGDDVYSVNSGGDIVREATDEGDDRVIASVNHTLSDNVERLTLVGGANRGNGNALDNVIMGGANDDRLQGRDGSDILTGGAGVDILLGGAGDDRYLVHVGDELDVIQEAANAGFDRVISSIDFVLGTNMERVDLVGAADSAIGNNFDNYLIGGANDDHLEGRGGSDYLVGGAGIDTLIGGTGDDRYVINPGDEVDVIVEAANEGYDRVIAGIDYVLDDHFERIDLIGAADHAIGNELDNILTGRDNDDLLEGRDGSDVLIGRLGLDTLTGGMGDDRYILGAGDEFDVIIEAADQGYDRVQAGINTTLGDHLERIDLVGAADQATGNALDNTLVGSINNDLLDGSGGADVIIGGNGNDTIIGGAGTDRLTGGLGADVFAFATLADSQPLAAARDSITDFSILEGDVIRLGMIDADTVTTGMQSFTFIDTAQFGGHAGELRVSLLGSWTLVQGDVDGDRSADFAIRLLNATGIGASAFDLSPPD